MWVWLLLLILLAAVAIAPFWVERLRPAIGKTARRGSDGAYARLSQGVTHYRWHGPVRGPVIVAIHGLTTPSPVWDDIAARLTPLGYRVLSYDLYGRGLSDAPRGPQDADFFLRQLTDLLDHEGIDDDITLMGYSMGGSIATAFTKAQPERVRRLILLAAAGVVQNESGFSRFCRQTPLLGDWLYHAVAPRRMAQEYAAASWAGQADMAAVQTRELARAGFIPAVLSSRRHMLAQHQEAAHRAIARTDIPVVAIWGGADTVIPIQALGELARWNRDTRQDVIEEADHGLPYTHAPQVADVLTEILTGRDA